MDNEPAEVVIADELASAILALTSDGDTKPSPLVRVILPSIARLVPSHTNLSPREKLPLLSRKKPVLELS